MLDGESVQGWINHVRFADTWGLRRSVLDDLVLRPASRPDPRPISEQKNSESVISNPAISAS